MYDVNSVYEDVENFFIKDEPETDDAPENSNTWGAQEEKIVFHETQTKCGDVFVGYQGDFTLVCSVCKDEFETFKSFGVHIKESHMGLKLDLELRKELIFTDPLPIWDDTNRPHISSREGNTKNYGSNENPIPTQSEPVAQASQLTIHGSLQLNQQDANTGIKQRNYICEEESSGNEFTPEKDVDSKSGAAEPRKEYFCIYCGRTYVTRRYFVAHNKKKHNIIPTKKAGDVDAPHVEPVKMVCKYCDRKFDDQIDFKTHMSIHTGRNRFVCPLCPKKFIGRRKRDMHVNTHTGERPFKCTHCPKAFSDVRNLEMHVRMHLGIMKFSCDYCDKRFVQSTEKKLHERTHTGERPYQCEECGWRFIAHVQLMEHRKRHMNIRNYKCEVCSKAYYNSTLLKNHMRTHTGERPFLCNICSQPFAQRRALRTHQKLHKKEEKGV